ncbi:hypothetical protein Tther_02143 [Tepidimonas thermarum]|uniref:DUF2946 domain-containing protein n=2 Tax=Tepidimonas thermarum TaxID=335431 RepID=A0A554WXQ4_9BURK|nr:hypothetical protein Tther_02143 [Tepidimonas thermarum]
MMGGMVRIVVWCLLALLPWRLWAADAMALRACHGSTPAAVTGAAPAAVPDDPAHGAHHAGSHAAHPVHHGGAAQPAAHTAGTATPDATGSHHVTCTLCDLCHNPPLHAAVGSATANGGTGGWVMTQWRVPPTPIPGPPLKPPIA